MRSPLYLLLLWGLQMIVSVAQAQAREFEHEGDSYLVFSCAPSQIRMVWCDDGGKPLRRMEKARKRLAKEGTVAMLMNGGIYEPGEIPSGLYIEKGRVLSPLNQKKGQGNFFLKPNGVFAITSDGSEASAEVMPTSAFAKWTAEERASLIYAMQSGPLLLHDGRVHPAFRKESASRLLRNGVGIDGEGRVISVISRSEGGVNLWTFAECFRALGCQDALYLDGTISEMKINPRKGSGRGRFATFIAAMKSE